MTELYSFKYRPKHDNIKWRRCGFAGLEWYFGICPTRGHLCRDA